MIKSPNRNALVPAQMQIKKYLIKGSFGSRFMLFFFFFVFIFYLNAQPQDIPRGESQIARQYIGWARQAIAEDRWSEALLALELAADFSGVSSDVSFLLALARSNENKSRNSVLEALNKAIEVNRWEEYSGDDALLFKIEQLIAMRRYADAFECLDKIRNHSAQEAVLRLLAARGYAVSANDAQAFAHFRSLVLITMDRYPRDPRPLRIFFEYARNRKPEPLDLPESDINLLDLANRRLPMLLETDPSLAWMAAPFVWDAEYARRLTASYRSGSLFREKPENFRPAHASLPIALHLGLIDDNQAINELFSEQALDRNVIGQVYKYLRSEEGRGLFTQKILSFSGIIISDDDFDGYTDTRAEITSGVIRKLELDINQGNVFDLKFFFGADGVPVSAIAPVGGYENRAAVTWERYPSAEKITLGSEEFYFGPADFQYAPFLFTELGGSDNIAGLSYPVSEYRNMTLSYRALIAFCSSFSRPSAEFDGGKETIFMRQGMPLMAVETVPAKNLNGKNVSVTEFENGLPVIQRLDLDLDGRIETIRRFRRPGPGFSDTLNYRALIMSSESDWTGEGKFKTGEVYLPDGSVVYSWDMDGSGEMNYRESGTEK
ncbi:MAG: hypothetical protein LBH16_09335 [Treponema sp.]|nr:hypothetical protein [Treponema sp.]